MRKTWRWLLLGIISIGILGSLIYISIPSPELYKHTIIVHGMSCDGCTHTLSAALHNTMDTITDISVNRDKNIILITSEQPTLPTAVIETINALGYQSALPARQGKIEVIDFKVRFQ